MTTLVNEMNPLTRTEVLVVTGGIACGKSTFCDVWGEVVPDSVRFCADDAVHAIYRDPDVVGRLVDLIGCPVLDDGSVDRDQLREVVLSAPEKRKQLESIVHPMVRRAAADAYRQACAGGARWFLADIPLYFEGGGRFLIDSGVVDVDPAVVVVAVSETVQQARMRVRNQFDNTTTRAILAAQMPVAEKIGMASFVIWNEGSLDVLRDQVDILHDRLIASGHHSSTKLNAPEHTVL